MKFLNLTKDWLIPRNGGTDIVPSGTVVSMVPEEAPLAPIRGIPCHTSGLRLEGVLPPPEDGTVLIVPADVRRHHPWRNDLASPSPPSRVVLGGHRTLDGLDFNTQYPDSCTA